MSEIKVMSFNLRMDTEYDGINRFRNRIPRVLEVISAENPHIIGFQEVTDYMRGVLKEKLTDYTLVGCGRGVKYNDESMTIAFKTKDFDIISLENIWLSETPDVPGSRYGYDHSGCPRMFTSVKLKWEKSDTPLYFINTHLDHEGEYARFLESTQLCDYIKKLDNKFILTGDFNAPPETKEIKIVTESLSDIGCIDCTENLGITFHSFLKLPEERYGKIDYIFSNEKLISSYKVPDIMEDGKFYSDHNAVVAILDVK